MLVLVGVLSEVVFELHLLPVQDALAVSVDKSMSVLGHDYYTSVSESVKIVFSLFLVLVALLPSHTVPSNELSRADLTASHRLRTEIDILRKG